MHKSGQLLEDSTGLRGAPVPGDGSVFGDPQTRSGNAGKRTKRKKRLRRSDEPRQQVTHYGSAGVASQDDLFKDTLPPTRQEKCVSCSKTTGWVVLASATAAIVVGYAGPIIAKLFILPGKSDEWLLRELHQGYTYVEINGTQFLTPEFKGNSTLDYQAKATQGVFESIISTPWASSFKIVQTTIVVGVPALILGAYYGINALRNRRQSGYTMLIDDEGLVPASLATANKATQGECAKVGKVCVPMSLYISLATLLHGLMTAGFWADRSIAANDMTEAEWDEFLAGKVVGSPEHAPDQLPEGIRDLLEDVIAMAGAVGEGFGVAAVMLIMLVVVINRREIASGFQRVPGLAQRAISELTCGTFCNPDASKRALLGGDETLEEDDAIAANRETEGSHRLEDSSTFRQ